MLVLYLFKRMIHLTINHKPNTLCSHKLGELIYVSELVCTQICIPKVYIAGMLQGATNKRAFATKFYLKKSLRDFKQSRALGARTMEKGDAVSKAIKPNFYVSKRNSSNLSSLQKCSHFSAINSTTKTKLL